MALKLMGKKRGMIKLFDEKGNIIVGTVIEAQPNVITQIKTNETDGYNAIQLGFEKIVVKDERTISNRVNKPQLGHFKKAAVEPVRHLAESRIDDVTNYQVGQEISVDLFQEKEYVDATAISKGKGYQGVMKLYNFAGGPASHGSGFHRHAGSTGMRSTPGRCLPGGKRASHMGYDRVTVQNLKVLMVKPEDNVIIVKGQVPGPKNGLVYLSQAKKKHITNK
ncbi:50S ribosomal protein L3 [Candidatus Rubidus massiliensis]|nr:MAG: 50S ribosomal protein L3 [Chlamydia sp. 32-24]CDZ80462.1 50S ribosomal protein L3 [Candidatus Rubidus massiliensis]